MLMLNRDRIAGAAILLACTGLFYEAWGYPPDSRLFPLGLLAFLAAGAVVMIVRPARAPAEAGGAPKRIVQTLLLCLGYVALVEVLGYFFATALFMTGFMAMMGLRNPLIYIAAIAAVDACLYLLFVWQLKVPVPTGILFQ